MNGVAREFWREVLDPHVPVQEERRRRVRDRKLTRIRRSSAVPRRGDRRARVELGDRGLDHDRPQSVGKIREFWGNTQVILKAYAWARAMGAEGIAQDHHQPDHHHRQAGGAWQRGDGDAGDESGAANRHDHAVPAHARRRLASFLAQRCFLVVVTVADQDSAYRIFSVLNDRGLELGATDILKADIIGGLAAAGADTGARRDDPSHGERDRRRQQAQLRARERPGRLLGRQRQNG